MDALGVGGSGNLGAACKAWGSELGDCYVHCPIGVKTSVTTRTTRKVPKTKREFEKRRKTSGSFR
jgi:hypothetical protein